MEKTEEYTTESLFLTKTARIVSGIFSPFIIPFLAFMLLFAFTYLHAMPKAYKIIVLSVVACFTIVMPVLTIFIFRRINGLASEDLSDRKKRYIPYFLTITSYIFCVLMMYRLKMPFYMISIIWVSLLIMIIFTIVNIKWKLSEHMGGMGALIGGIVSFSALIGYNPVWWLCIIILVTGIVGSARIILDRNTLIEVLTGFTIGLVCSILVLHPLSGSLLKLFL